jgi:hypothetical protein
MARQVEHFEALTRRALGTSKSQKQIDLAAGERLRRDGELFPFGGV